MRRNRRKGRFRGERTLSISSSPDDNVQALWSACLAAELQRLMPSASIIPLLQRTFAAAKRAAEGDLDEESERPTARH